MNSTTYIHPKLIIFWNLLAYPKWLIKIALIMLIAVLIPAYVFSQPEMFVEHIATITGIEFSRGINMRESDSLRISYQYIYKNKLFESLDSHFLPKGYPDEKVSEYVSKWKRMHPDGSIIKIIVNDWRPNYSAFSKLNEFKVNSKPWFASFALYFFIYYWFFSILVLTLISMLIKYFSMRPRNDE